MTTISNNIIQVLAGVVPGHTRIDKFCKLPAVTTTLRDVWDTASGGATEVDEMVYLGGLGTAEQIRIERDQLAADQAGGLGAQRLVILGIDDDGYFQQVVYPLGATDPQITDEKWLRIFRMIVAGPANQAGDFHIPNVGNISAFANVSNTLQARVNSEEGITHMSHFTIPRGFIATGYVLVPMAGIGKEIGLVARSRTIIPARGVYEPDSMGAFFHGREYTITEGGMPHTEQSLLEELTDIHFEAALPSASAGVTFSMFYQLELMRTSFLGNNNFETITAEIKLSEGLL